MADVFARSLDDSGEVGAEQPALRPSEPGCHARQIRRAGEHVPVVGIHRRRMDANEGAAGLDRWRFDLSQTEDVG